jgi:hypothetical protein
MGARALAELGLEGDETGVEGPFRELADDLRRLELAKYERQFGKPARNRRRDLGQEIGSDGRDHADAQCPGERIARARRGRNEVLQFEEHTTRTIDKLLPGRRDEYAAPVTLEELHSQRRLELLDLGAKRGLRDVTALGRAMKPKRVGHRDRVLKLAQ